MTLTEFEARPGVDLEAQALFEEARHRRRRRWFFGCAVVVVGATSATAVVVGGGGAHGGRPRSGPSTGPSVAPASGPCAGQPLGCGTRQGSASALMAARWSSLPSGPLSARGGQASAWTGHQMVIWGGAASKGPGEDGLADGAAYNPTTSTWSLLPPSPLRARGNATALSIGHEAMFWGGEYIESATRARDFADGAVYNSVTSTWRTLPASPLSARSEATGIWTGTQAIIIGGWTAKHVPLFDGATYDPASNQWRLLPTLPLAHDKVGYAMTAAWDGTQLLVWVNEERRTPATGPSFETLRSQQDFSWTPGSSSWSHRPSPPPAVDTDNASTVWTGHQLLLLAGNDCDGLGMPCGAAPFTGHGWQVDPVSGHWESVPSNVILVENLPVTWTGRAVVALNQGAEGGSSGFGPELLPGDAAVYDPADAQWTALAPGPVKNLNEASVAWTGTQLLVWDGQGGAHGRPAGEILTPPPA